MRCAYVKAVKFLRHKCSGYNIHRQLAHPVLAPRYYMWIRRAVLNLLNLLSLILLVCTTQGRLVNVSIDDHYGDPTTGQIPVYQPVGPWGDQDCPACAIVPLKSMAFDETWHEATYNPSLNNNIFITFSFTA